MPSKHLQNQPAKAGVMCWFLLRLKMPCVCLFKEGDLRSPCLFLEPSRVSLPGRSPYFAHPCDLLTSPDLTQGFVLKHAFADFTVTQIGASFRGWSDDTGRHRGNPRREWSCGVRVEPSGRSSCRHGGSQKTGDRGGTTKCGKAVQRRKYVQHCSKLIAIDSKKKNDTPHTKSCFSIHMGE